MRQPAQLEIDELLQLQRIQPVLVDVGASGSPPVLWESIAKHSHYIGFDPDLREIRDDQGGSFARATMIAEAVTASPDASSVTFHLTESPFCSSVLEPDFKSLDDWSFRRLFDVVRTATVAATTLDRVLDRLAVPTMDWLKLDTQGTDLRIVQSLSDARANGLVAIDVEPGLIDAYRGEDLFVDVHRALVNSGYWLSRLDVQGSTRSSVSTMTLLRNRHPELERGLLARGRVSPGWCEARYLRRLDSVDWRSERQAILLWAFSLLDGQPGAALDLAFAWEARVGRDGISRAMVSGATAALRPSAGQRLAGSVRRHVPRPVKSIARRMLGR